MFDNSVISMITTASNCPLTGKDFNVFLIFFNLAADSQYQAIYLLHIP